MARIVIVSRLTALEGRRADLAAAMSLLFDQVAGEPGTEVFVMHEARDEPDVLVFYEVYRDADALATHQAGETLRSIVPSLQALMAKPPEITYATGTRAKGVEVG